MKKIITGIVLVFILIPIIISSIYIIREDEVGVIQSFGKIKSIVINKDDYDMVKTNLEINQMDNIEIIDTKGIHIKIPFIQTVKKYSSKYLTYKSKYETIETSDRRKIDVQLFAQYRIVDPAKFLQGVNLKSQANTKLDLSVYPAIIQSANTLVFDDFFQKDIINGLLGAKKVELNKQLMKNFGLNAVDIGINRKNFPISNIQSIEEKMTKEIEKESQKLIAEGDSAYKKAEAETDRIRKEMVSVAKEAAAIIKAGADAESIRIYQKALQKDIEFYKFTKRMETYRNIDGSTIYLGSDNDFLKYINGY